MNYQVLARKWRPKKFKELMGQEHVVNVLVNALAQQRLHHAYLFTGTRGVGKTTIARIFAKSLNCQQGVSSEPCGVCDTCLDIDQGRFVDLLEIDAASRTKVDDTREILDNVQYAPSRGRYKVYLIDEVHMLSRSSFNALLKTLEEPPEHVKFILATTDPQKLPVTVLSRCLQFHLKALSVTQIKQQLSLILTAENVDVDQEAALSLLAKAARGSMRDSLSLTDQAIAQGQGSITLTNVQQMLGGIDQHWPYKIIIMLIKQDIKSLMALSLEIAAYSPNYSRLLAELIQLLHQIAIAQVIDSHFDLSPEHTSLLKKFTQAMSPEDVQLYYQIALNGRKDLPYAIDEQAAFDMTLLRLAAFQPAANAEQVISSPSSTVESIDFDHDESSLSQVRMPEINTSETTLPDIEDNNLSSALDKTSIESKEQALAEQLQEVEITAQSQGFQSTPLVNSPDIEQKFTSENEPLNNAFLSQDNAQLDDNETSLNSHELSEQVDEQTKIISEKASPIEEILASRNVLRSKRKKQEQQVKKSEGAVERHQHNEITPLSSAENTPVSELANETYNPDIIDPATIHSANQVDKWANMIDHMSLNGRLRQLAIHATIGQNSNDDHLVLLLNQSTKHLQSEAAHSQLKQSLSQLLSRDITVEIQVVNETVADPYQIQSDINQKRYDYAKELLKKDDVVVHLQEHFQAELDEESIVAK